MKKRSGSLPGLLSLLLALAVSLILLPGATLAAETKAPPTTFTCSATFGYDFKLAFSSSDMSWLNAVNKISVNETIYTKAAYSSQVWNDTDYYVCTSYEPYYLLIGEGYSGDSPATCVISADGYQDLTLELDKTNHTATVKETSGGDSGETTTYDVTVASSITNGSVSVNPPSAAESSTVAITATANPGYTLSTLTVTKANGGTVDTAQGASGTTEYTFTMPAEAVTVSATFKEIPAGDKTTVAAPSFTNVSSVFSSYYELAFSDNGYVKGISAVLLNGSACDSSSYSSFLHGTQYYKNADENKLYLASSAGTVGEATFQSGDVITIQNPAYQDLKLKVTIVGDTVTIAPDDGEGDAYALHVRLVGTFEAAVVNQSEYDGVSGATTSVTTNKNSNAEVQAVLLKKDVTPAETDWKALKDTNIKVNKSKTYVTITPDGSGMVGVYSTYDSSVTLAGTPANAGSYEVSVTVTDDQGRTATSNALPFTVYDPNTTTLSDRLKVDDFTQTQDGKYMWDMEPWTISRFGGASETVTVPDGLKAWYGSHTSGTYGKLGYSVGVGNAPTQTLIVPDSCNLTLVNMDVLSSVKIVVQNGGKLVLRDSVIQGVVEVQSGGTFSMNYDDYSEKFLSGASINGQIVLKDGATLENALIYSNTNFIAEGDQARHNTAPVVAVEGDVTLKGQVFIRGDEAATGEDPSTGKSYAGQTGLSVTNGTLTLTDGATLAVYGGGKIATTTNGGAAVILNKGTITGNGKLIAVGGEGNFGDGGDAVQGTGTISTAQAYLQGGSTFKPATGSDAGKAKTSGVSLTSGTKAKVIDGVAYQNESDNPNTPYWSDTKVPDSELLKKYDVSADDNTGKDDSGNKGDSSSGGGSKPTTYTVSTPSKVSNGSVSVSPRNANKGATVTVTVNPNSGYTLETLTVTDKNGNTIELTKKSDTQYTFTMPASKVSIEVSFMEDNAMLNHFTDVPAGAFYYDAVLWAARNGITTGTSATTFAPDEGCTRAQVVTFLWRAAGSPKAAGTNPFTDLDESAYYYDAVLWAAEQGITTGTSATTFDPDATATRGQAVTFLYRMAGSPKAAGHSFTDVNSSDYYNDAVGWAFNNGITTGTGNNRFSPNSDCTRGQFVTLLYRSAQ